MFLEQYLIHTTRKVINLVVTLVQNIFNLKLSNTSVQKFKFKVLKTLETLN